MFLEVLASAYIAQMTVNTIGPFGLFDDLRSRYDHASWLGMLHCAWCMSFWSAGLITWLNPDRSVIRWFAIAFLSGLIVWALSIVQDLLNELVQMWRVRP